VRIAVAEPERDRTAPTALEIDILRTVFVTISYARAYERS